MPFNEPVIVAVVFEADFVVFIVNEAVVLPAATITVAGTVTEDSLLWIEIANPPVGAGLLMVTIPVALLPPTIFAALSFIETRVGLLIVRPALAEEVPNAAEIVEIT